MVYVWCLWWWQPEELGIQYLREKERRTRVPGFSGKGHQVVLVQLARLVVGRFQDRRASHRGFGGGDDGEVFAGDAE